MNEMMENKYPYDNWKSITESDFVTLFIKTWFAFVSTLREMYPAEIPYYQATGDSRYISPYKRDFSQNIAYAAPVRQRVVRNAELLRGFLHADLV